jgi:Domain of unknown function (DUF4926)
MRSSHAVPILALVA